MLLFTFEKQLLKSGKKIIIGMDEAGRGPLAGPLAVGVVVFDYDFLEKNQKLSWWREVNDSKKLSAKKREKLYKYIAKNMSFAVGMVSAKLIDRIGITKATEEASKKALRKIKLVPDVLLVDGIRKFITKTNHKQKLFKRGDSRIFSIACASIVAKVERDRFMLKCHKKWPKYCFCDNKGYGTARHIKTIQEVGPCPLHRLSFAPLSHLVSRQNF